MTVELLTEHHLEFLSLNGGYKACLSLRLSKCYMVEITCRGPYVLCKTTTVCKRILLDQWGASIAIQLFLFSICLIAKTELSTHIFNC